MQTYILRRLLMAVPTLIGVTILIFVGMRVLPGDVLAAMFGAQEGMVRVSAQDREKIIASLGLDKPLHRQYLAWMGEIARGDLGESFWRGQSARELIVRRGPITAQIAFLAVAVSWIIGLPVGVLGALRQNTTLDYISRVATILFLAIPGFWLGSIVLLVAVLVFQWMPPFLIVQLWESPRENLLMIMGPGIVMGVGGSAYIARMARSAILEILREDYVRTARAKGLSEPAVMFRHVLKNAVLPVITLSAVMLGYLLGGSVAVEKALNVPGLGNALVGAVMERDYAIIQSLVLLYGVIFVFLNLAVDVLYGLVDPRIRYQ